MDSKYEAQMTEKEFMKTASHFFPNIKEKALVCIRWGSLYNVVHEHYLKIDKNVYADVEYKYKSRGYLKTISGRKIENIDTSQVPALDVLTMESCKDIIEKVKELLNCDTPGTNAYTICEFSEIDGFKKKIQEVVDSFNLRVKSPIEIEVSRETNDY